MPGSPAEEETNREQLGKLEILRHASRSVYSSKYFEQSQKLSYYLQAGAMDFEVTGLDAIGKIGNLPWNPDFSNL